MFGGVIHVVQHGLPENAASHGYDSFTGLCLHPLLPNRRRSVGMLRMRFGESDRRRFPFLLLVAFGCGHVVSWLSCGCGFHTIKRWYFVYNNNKLWSLLLETKYYNYSTSDWIKTRFRICFSFYYCTLIINFQVITFFGLLVSFPLLHMYTHMVPLVCLMDTSCSKTSVWSIPSEQSERDSKHNT